MGFHKGWPLASQRRALRRLIWQGRGVTASGCLMRCYQKDKPVLLSLVSEAQHGPNSEITLRYVYVNANLRRRYYRQESGVTLESAVDAQQSISPGKLRTEIVRCHTARMCREVGKYGRDDDFPSSFLIIWRVPGSALRTFDPSDLQLFLDHDVQPTATRGLTCLSNWLLSMMVIRWVSLRTEAS